MPSSYMGGGRVVARDALAAASTRVDGEDPPLTRRSRRGRASSGTNGSSMSGSPRGCSSPTIFMHFTHSS